MKSGGGEPKVEDGGPNEPGRQPAQRRFGAARVRPRVQISRTPLPPQNLPEPEPVGEGPYAGEPAGLPVFGQPREFAGGRVRVWGCSPGCIIASIALSLLLSWLLSALFS